MRKPIGKSFASVNLASGGARNHVLLAWTYEAALCLQSLPLLGQAHRPVPPSKEGNENRGESNARREKPRLDLSEIDVLHYPSDYEPGRPVVRPSLGFPS